jgi:hypothetical protein
VGGTVGAGTVAGVLAVGDDHRTVVERQPWPLQLRQLVLARVRHGRLVQYDLAGEQVEPEKTVHRFRAASCERRHLANDNQSPSRAPQDNSL